MLSDRRQRILAALIEEYVARALPVGSRTLAEQYGFEVSSATIRNDLSALEGEGYITQPHTSAGRIPTDFGYRAFVDHLVETGVVGQDEEAGEAVSQLRAKAGELDDLLEQTSSALAQFTNCLSIVAPAGMAHPKRLGLSSLMRQPEFEHSRALLPIMQVLEDDTVLLHVLDASAPSGPEAAVLIGGENAAEQLAGVSLVACRYGAGEDEGIVAVIGPTRMNYSKVLSAVRMASRMLGEE